MTALDLVAIEARANAATDGGWDVAESEHYGRLVWGFGVDYDPSDPTGQTAMQTQEIVAQQIPRTADAVFIAHAREDVPRLVEEIRAQRERAARVRELEAAARVDYAALRADVDNASVVELAAAEARVVALAEAADVYEGVAF